MFNYSQWLIRLFFQPSLWRDHLATNFNLSEDFSIADLSNKQWRNSEIQTVLIIGLIIVPLLLSIVVGLVALLLLVRLRWDLLWYLLHLVA